MKEPIRRILNEKKKIGFRSKEKEKKEERNQKRKKKEKAVAPIKENLIEVKKENRSCCRSFYCEKGREKVCINFIFCFWIEVSCICGCLA